MEIIHRIFSLRQMAVDLRENKIGASEARAYAAILIVLFAAGQFDAILFDMRESGFATMLINLTVSVVAILVPLAIAWIANGKKEGKRFWYRFFSLQIPIGIYMVFMGTILIFVLFETNLVESTLANVLWYLPMLISFCLVFIYMKIAAGRA